MTWMDVLKWLVLMIGGSAAFLLVVIALTGLLQWLNGDL